MTIDPAPAQREAFARSVAKGGNDYVIHIDDFFHPPGEDATGLLDGWLAEGGARVLVCGEAGIGKTFLAVRTLFHARFPAHGAGAEVTCPGEEMIPSRSTVDAWLRRTPSEGGHVLLLDDPFGVDRLEEHQMERFLNIVDHLKKHPRLRLIVTARTEVFEAGHQRAIRDDGELADRWTACWRTFRALFLGRLTRPEILGAQPWQTTRTILDPYTDPCNIIATYAVAVNTACAELGPAKVAEMAQDLLRHDVPRHPAEVALWAASPRVREADAAEAALVLLRPGGTGGVAPRDAALRLLPNIRSNALWPADLGWSFALVLPKLTVTNNRAHFLQVAAVLGVDRDVANGLLASVLVERPVADFTHEAPLSVADAPDTDRWVDYFHADVARAVTLALLADPAMRLAQIDAALVRLAGSEERLSDVLRSALWGDLLRARFKLAVQAGERAALADAPAGGHLVPVDELLFSLLGSLSNTVEVTDTPHGSWPELSSSWTEPWAVTAMATLSGVVSDLRGITTNTKVFDRIVDSNAALQHALCDALEDASGAARHVRMVNLALVLGGLVGGIGRLRDGAVDSRGLDLLLSVADGPYPPVRSLDGQLVLWDVLVWKVGDLLFQSEHTSGEREALRSALACLHAPIEATLLRIASGPLDRSQTAGLLFSMLWHNRWSSNPDSELHGVWRRLIPKSDIASLVREGFDGWATNVRYHDAYHKRQEESWRRDLAISWPERHEFRAGVDEHLDHGAHAMGEIGQEQTTLWAEAMGFASTSPDALLAEQIGYLLGMRLLAGPDEGLAPTRKDVVAWCQWIALDSAGARRVLEDVQRLPYRHDEEARQRLAWLRAEAGRIRTSRPS